MYPAIQLILLALISAIIPLLLCRVAAWLHRGAPLVIGAAVTWVAVLMLQGEIPFYLKGFIAQAELAVSAPFLLGSFFSMIFGGAYLMAQPVQVPEAERQFSLVERSE